MFVDLGYCGNNYQKKGKIYTPRTKKTLTPKLKAMQKRRSAIEPVIGHKDGYPLIELTPSHRGLQVDGYRPESASDFLQQGWAVLRRRFREGPHERLGLLDRVRMENCAGDPILEYCLPSTSLSLKRTSTMKKLAGGALCRRAPNTAGRKS